MPMPFFSFRFSIMRFFHCFPYQHNIRENFILFNGKLLRFNQTTFFLILYWYAKKGTEVKNCYYNTLYLLKFLATLLICLFSCFWNWKQISMFFNFNSNIYKHSRRHYRIVDNNFINIYSQSKYSSKRLRTLQGHWRSWTRIFVKYKFALFNEKKVF